MQRFVLPALALLAAFSGPAWAQTPTQPEGKPGVTRPEGKEGVTRPGPGQEPGGTGPAGGAKGGSAAPS